MNWVIRGKEKSNARVRRQNMEISALFNEREKFYSHFAHDIKSPFAHFEMVMKMFNDDGFDRKAAILEINEYVQKARKYLEENFTSGRSAEGSDDTETEA